MESENKLRLADVFVSIRDPRQRRKVEHDLVEVLVIAVNAVLVGADTFVEIELWAKEKQDWLRQYLKLEKGIPSHDTFGRLVDRAPVHIGRERYPLARHLRTSVGLD